MAVLCQPGEHAQHIPVNCRPRLFKCDRRDCPRRVSPDPRKCQDLLIFLRELSVMLLTDHLCRPPEIARARIVPQSFPQLKKFLIPTRRKRCDRGKTLHKTLEIRDHCLDARLLQHDLRHPHAVRIPVLPPRQTPAILMIPVRQRRDDLS